MSDKDACVQCMPLFSLLAAINVTTVDYFSLDVEGSELQVLKTIPFDKLFIRTLSVEIAHTKEGRYALLKFMESRGYKMHGKVKVLKPGKIIESQGYKMHGKKKMQTQGKFADDFIFVHKDADGKIVKVPVADFMSGKLYILPQDDPQIIDYIWTNDFILPPSEDDYDLKEPEVDPSCGQGQYIRKLMKNMTNGFFVEYGALDGETESNTLFMEKHLHWKGLLVEKNRNNFALLKEKNRKAWISNTCLSTKPYPHTDALTLENTEDETYDEYSGNQVEIQCMPLFSLLAAINVTTVDYFSLDLEESELQVLETIPLDKVFIQMVSVKKSHVEEENDKLLKFMQYQGYIIHGKVKGQKQDMFAEYLIFLHKDSTSIKS